MVPEQHRSDIDWILSHRRDQGWDWWTTEDLRLGNGGVLSALNCARLLKELGIDDDDPLLQTVSRLIFATLRADGRFRLAPKGSIYPCQTIQALDTLCHLGHARDPRLDRTWDHLLSSRHSDGGWRCQKFIWGHGPETEASNPGPTLTALDAFRHRPDLIEDGGMDPAVGFLLDHWRTRLPLGPCHYGIGSLFLQTEYPFMTYNLFQYAYVLSFYPAARADERFREALAVLSDQLVDGQIVIRRSNPKLKGLKFCEKGSPSELGTRRYQEILANLAGGD